MHDFLFLPRSHKEVGRNRLPGPGEYCISLYRCRGLLRERTMPPEWNPEWYAFPWLALSSFTYTTIPFRPTRATTFLVVLSNRVQLACTRPTHRVLQFVRTGAPRVLGDTMISHRYARHESEQPTSNESLEKETTRSNSESWLSFSLSLSLSLW